MVCIYIQLLLFFETKNLPAGRESVDKIYRQLKLNCLIPANKIGGEFLLVVIL